MSDLQSILGYADFSPFRNNPYLDIRTPEGFIDMQNTSMDLLGIDNLGNSKRMKAGSKKQYKFPGDVVREIPVKRNPYQQGGLTPSQMFNFLFDEDEDAPKKQEQLPTAPSTDEVDQSQMEDLAKQNEDQQSDALAMSTLEDRQARGNPYSSRASQMRMQGNPYTGEILSSGQFGNKNIGEYGRQIYGQLSQDLGYAPTVNSIFRSKAQNDALIAAGAPAVKNSWHLTGNAIDLKPQDWHKLSNEKQQFYRMNYDVIYHDNHYHIEPKN